MRLKALSIIILFISCGTLLSAQEEVIINKKEFKIKQKEGFKEAWKSIQEGDEYYDAGIGTFAIARDHYLFADQYNSDNPELNYKIGICYLYSDDKINALDYLLKAYELKPEISEEVHYLLGRAYHLVLEFDRAKENYIIYKSSLPPSEDLMKMTDALEKLIIECTHGKSFTQKPQRVIIQNMGEAVNSKFDEYNPKFAYQDSALFFTSRRPLTEKTKRSEIDNKFPEDIYISPIENGKMKDSYPLGKPFNSKGNDALVGVSPDGASFFIYKGDVDGGDIQIATYRPDKQKWNKPKSLKGDVGSDAEETTAALTPDGKELYFVSTNPKLSRGGKDIMVSKLTPKGKWGEPENASPLLNSKYDEEGIFLSADGNTMFYGSKGHNSMGGFDIFKSVKGEDGRWSAPENLGYPINTPEDEVFYTTDITGVYGYYATIREGGYGARDIYKVITLGSEKEVSTLTKDRLIAGTDYPERSSFITMPELLHVDTTLMVIGMVRDTIGGVDTTVMAGLSFIDPNTGDISARAMTGTDGYYRAQLAESKVYGIEINATGYLYFLDIIDLSGLDTDDQVKRDFYLQRIEVGTKVVLENIYFETGKSVLTVESYEPLNQVGKFLENNESVRLEISGHTDNTGSVSINTKLSQQRAKAVVDYLIGQKIDKSRFEYVGFADSQPVAPNDTPEGREMNRRVEFKVLSK
jgi:outer membrane protein OmpA-like peptidoglycan-associated protein